MKMPAHSEVYGPFWPKLDRAGLSSRVAQNPKQRPQNGTPCHLSLV